MDNELQAFLEEVEKLSIDHEPAAYAKNDDKKAVVDEENSADDDCPKVHVNANENNDGNISSASQSRAEKKAVIANANNSRRAWSEFKKLDLSNTSSSAEGGDKTKVSFQIKSAKGKKEKRKKQQPAKQKQTSLETTVSDKLNNGAAPVAGQKQTASEGPISKLGNVSDVSEYECPRWTLIIDTCSLIQENGIDVQKLIDIANHAANANQQQQNGGLVTMVEELIDIVIPFKVWGELDYQSKLAENDNAYAARRAIRMLRDEMEKSGDTIHAKKGGSKNYKVTRSQSLMESREAADNFLAKDLQSTNDDHILACAIMENAKFNVMSTSSNATTAGGVVIVTLDNNLACKALANGLRANSPSQFYDYYVRRMNSLRQRAAGQLADSALRR